MHGFLLVKSAQGKVVGVGDVVQIAEGSHVRSRLVFRFRDGSIDDESTVFMAGDVLHLISDHHVQKGPSFPRPLDQTINVASDEVTWTESKSGKQEMNRTHLELPNDLANGVIPLVMENISPSAAETKVSYLAGGPKPRIVTLSVKPESRDRFTVGGLGYSANLFVVHVEVGGIKGMVAPVIGKQPPDIRDWVAAGEVPSFARMEGPFYEGGPIWTVELTSPVWPSDTKAR